MIGHASKDENGKYKGGSPGDQTGQEVCKRSWYYRPWNVILRAIDDNIRESLAVAMERACDNNNIGYDQNNRNTLYDAVKYNYYDPSKVKTPVECDCSSLVSVCMMFAGVPERFCYSNGNCKTTSTLKSAALNSGMFVAITSRQYLMDDAYLMRGDILLYEGHHTAINLTNGSKATQVSDASKFNQHLYDLQGAINDDGIAAIKKTGIYNAETDSALKKVFVKYGSMGNVVAWVQCRIGTDADGIAGTKTVKKTKIWQRAHGLIVDGIAGRLTIRSILAEMGVDL